MDISAPLRSTITLDDIAHGAANTCRYSGHIRGGYYEDGTPIPIHYSVAEHAVYVSLLLEQWGYDWRLQFAGLHHDSAESYLSDLARPMKSLVEAQYSPLEDGMDEAVARALNAPWLLEALNETPVKAADSWMLLAEASELLPSRGEGWAASAVNWGIADFSARQPDDPLPSFWQGERGHKIELVNRVAKTFFLDRHWELMNR